MSAIELETTNLLSTSSSFPRRNNPSFEEDSPTSHDKGVKFSVVRSKVGLVFLFSLLGILPLAERLGYATEQLACFTGPAEVMLGKLGNNLVLRKSDDDVMDVMLPDYRQSFTEPFENGLHMVTILITRISQNCHILSHRIDFSWTEVFMIEKCFIICTINTLTSGKNVSQ
ncbi:vacuolar cation/proton exchanger 3-like isoform X1 [Senna tora]|uniref:Vacuolar cation/proton exchanger 3-like isoform X1 n=1 Tax=Senna tora TaxID=362788 RepID=A0A834TUZ2_9FABA|nr:vacuolar cation/proton exchanger 3-like isoform X1 [Senna tora]